MEPTCRRQKVFRITRQALTAVFAVQLAVAAAVIADACFLRVIPDVVERIFFVQDVIWVSRLITSMIVLVLTVLLIREEATPRQSPREYLRIGGMVLLTVLLSHADKLAALG